MSNTVSAGFEDQVLLDVTKGGFLTIVASAEGENVVAALELPVPWAYTPQEWLGNWSEVVEAMALKVLANQHDDGSLLIWYTAGVGHKPVLMKTISKKDTPKVEE
jgi:hypothetical protein